MRKEYAHVLRQHFSQRFEERFPAFAPQGVKTIYFTPGDRAFENKLDDGTSLWISLHVDQKYECFNVEIGWSALGRWPELGMRPSPLRPDNHAEFEEQEYLTRLPFLWTENDDWFEIEPFDPGSDLASLAKKIEPIDRREARDKVAPVVEACIEKIAEYAIPYFENFLQRRTRS